MTDDTRWPAQHDGALAYEHILDPERYLVLVGALSTWRTAIGDDGQPCSPFLKSLAALQSVIDFLQADPAVHQQKLDGPLKELHAALHDRMQGAKPEFFDIEKAAGKPSNLHRDQLRGIVVAAYLLLRSSGMPAMPAATWVSTKVGGPEKRRSGTGVTGSQIVKWSERGQDRTAPTAQIEATNEFLNDARASLANGTVMSVEAAQSLSAGMLLVVRHNAFSGTIGIVPR